MLGFHQHAEANVISFSAAISACEKGQQWEQAMSLFEAIPQTLGLDQSALQVDQRWESGESWCEVDLSSTKSKRHLM